MKKRKHIEDRGSLTEYEPLYNHAIIVSDNPKSGRYVCSYEDHGKGDGAYRDFLRALACWLTEHRQGFLASPSLETLMESGEANASPSKYSPEVFLSLLLPDITTLQKSKLLEYLRGQEEYTHIIWARMNMPLVNLFSNGLGDGA